MAKNQDMGLQNKLVIFQTKEIRRLWHNDEWFYSVIDICGALTDSSNPRDYWYRVKKRLDDEEKAQLSTICRQLKIPAPDGKMRLTDCANSEGVFRIIQSIPSPKAEPFKRWLAKVGAERIEEIENPELAQARMKALYEKKGYSKDWIDKRLRGISSTLKKTFITNKVTTCFFNTPYKTSAYTLYVRSLAGSR